MKRLIFTALLCVCSMSASAQEDWGYLAKYDQQNKEIIAQPNDGKRVIFLGNSITENWRNMRSDFFTSHNYIGRGISGQTSYQFLVRFREDVIALKPKVVVINAGTNDVAQNNHPYVEDRTLGNIITMCELAKANKIKVILSSILPCGGFGWNPSIKDAATKIKSLNARIKQYAQDNKIPYIDYWTPMADDNGALKKEYTQDGCHPTEAGYAVMEPLAVKAIQKFVK